MSGSNSAPEIFRADDVAKSFGAVEALRGVSLSVKAGEVIGLVGDNGAGKSTFCKIITGVHPPTRGALLVDGVQHRFSGPHDAQARGIEMVHQDLALCEHLSAAMNIFLGQEVTWDILGVKFLRRRKMEARARQLLAELEVDLDVSRPIRGMSGGQRQAIAIARALLGDARLILLDEPTAAISITVVEQVLKLIRRLKERGKTVILISHRMPDIFEVCDRVVVLRRGRKVADKSLEDTSREEITSLITGALETA